MALLLGLVVFLYGFASHRNNLKQVEHVEVNFNNGKNLFISYEKVNKLLIQKLEADNNQSKENINLNNLENFLRSNQMIENAEVYLTVSGELGAIITQRNPVVRVANHSGSYYLDRLGKAMPLSDNYSARVPITSDVVEGNNIDDLIQLANYIQNDEFLKKQIIGIHQKVKQDKAHFELRTRLGDHTIDFGDLQRLKHKMNNLKVFYQKAIKDSTLHAYQRIDLKCKNQVVCAKN